MWNILNLSIDSTLILKLKACPNIFHGATFTAHINVSRTISRTNPIAHLMTRTMQRSNLAGTPSRPIPGELLISNSIFCSESHHPAAVTPPTRGQARLEMRICTSAIVAFCFFNVIWPLALRLDAGKTPAHTNHHENIWQFLQTRKDKSSWQRFCFPCVFWMHDREIMSVHTHVFLYCGHWKVSAECHCSPHRSLVKLTERSWLWWDWAVVNWIKVALSGSDTKIQANIFRFL